MRRHQGFTLIEVMIVVAIVAVLAAIAIPSYTDYVRRSQVTEAFSTASTVRIKMEQYFQDNRQYLGGCQSAIVKPSWSPAPAGSRFTYACRDDANTFLFTATGTGPIANFAYTLDQTNAKTSTFPSTSGWVSSTTCWVSKKDGSC
jgi:type IV pilus assembly protein PilE